MTKTKDKSVDYSNFLLAGIVSLGCALLMLFIAIILRSFGVFIDISFINIGLIGAVIGFFIGLIIFFWAKMYKH